MAKMNIGLRQAHRLCQMNDDDRLAFIAEGLPLILDSSRGLWSASQQLSGSPREAEILAGLAEEEAAKILILLDTIRCPKALIQSRLATMIRWFYDHLARLLYAKAVSWKPMHVAQLREYLDRERRSHYLEGECGEYIMPNWETFSREARLYVDVEADEDGIASWSSPHTPKWLGPTYTPSAILTVEALAAIGVYSVAGLRGVRDVWGTLEFKDAESFDDTRRLTKSLLERLIAENLPTESANQDHVDQIYNLWQMPMYNLEFGLVDVPRDELESARERELWAAAGY